MDEDSEPRIRRGADLQVAGETVRTELLSLGDQGRMAFARYGATSGPALFYFHGGGSCRFEAVTGAAVARELGFQIIAPDRPGYGASDPAQPWTLASWAPRVAALADALGIRRFAVAGLSAGGPYTLAAAAGLRGRIEALFPINTSAEPAHPAWRKNGLTMRVYVQLQKLFPAMNRRMLEGLRQDPVRTIRKSILPASDHAVVAADGGKFFAATFAEGMRQGVDAFLRDIDLIYFRPWDLDWRDSGAPVFFLHGREDPNLPFVRELARLHGHMHLVERPGGHLGGGTPDTWRTLHRLWQTA